MTQHQQIKQERQEELEKESHHRKKAQQSLYDQLKAPDEGMVDFQVEPSIDRHAALLANVRSDEQRANLVTQLQQSYGNAYVQRLLNARVLQAKLTVNSPDDEYEREADRVAEQVMSMTTMPAKPLAASITPLVQRQADGSFETESELESRLAANKGGGSPLPMDVRADMEPRFGVNFSGVRVHTDREAIQMNRELNAQAFTHGQDIYLGEGKYDPGSDAGKRSLAHELTHVVQQGGAMAEDDDMDIVPDWKAPIDPVADTLGEQPTTEIGWAQPRYCAEGETSIVQRKDGGDIVVFPSYATIIGDGTVKSAADNAWQETLAATTKTSRREQSFWIRWNSKKKNYSVTGKVVAPAVDNATTASVSPGAKPADAGDEYTVGLFHTHTPTRYRKYGRVVGPSKVDDNAHNNIFKVAGVVYDYIADKGNAIPAGHPLKAPAKTYHSGPNRRT